MEFTLLGSATDAGLELEKRYTISVDDDKGGIQVAGIRSPSSSFMILRGGMRVGGGFIILHCLYRMRSQLRSFLRASGAHSALDRPSGARRGGISVVVRRGLVDRMWSAFSR